MRLALFSSVLIGFAVSACHAAPAGEADKSNVESFMPPDAPSFTTLTASDEVPGEILIDAKDDVSESDIADLARIAGVPLHVASSLSSAMDKFEVADVDSADEDRILDALRGDPRVEHAEPMAI